MSQVSTQTLLEHAAQNMLEGNLDAAIAMATEGIEANPRFVRFYQVRQQCFRLKGDLKSAASDLRQALQAPGALDAEDRQHYQHELALIEANLARMNLGSAEEYLERATQLRDAGDYYGVMEDLAEAIRLDPNLAQAYVERCMVYLSLEHLQSAEVEINTAIRINPVLPGIYSDRGVVYHYLHRFDAALSDFDIALKQDPNDVLTYLARGQLYADMAAYRDAIADFTHLIELTPRSDAYRLRGSASAQAKDFVSAIEDYSKAIQLDRDNAELYYLRGAAYLNMGRFDEVVVECSHATQLDPKLSGAYQVLGAAFQAKKDLDNAVKNYTMAINLNPDEPLSYANRGKIYILLEDYVKAADDLRRFLTLGGGALTNRQAQIEQLLKEVEAKLRR